MQKQKYISFKRFIASALIVFLLMEPAAIAGSHPAGKNNPTIKLELPENLGSIEESWTGDTGKTVIFIQDAHDSLEAQENIAKMIHYLVDRHGIKTVYEEGFEGPVPTDKYFGKIKDSKVREKTAYFLMDKLRIGGAEYAHITRNKDFELIGADNLKLYRENIEWYQDSAANKNAAEKGLGAMDASIRKLAARYFTKGMKKWMSLKERFDGHQIDLLGYLKRIVALMEKSGRPVLAGNYPNISLLLASEKSNDPALLEKVKSMKGRALFEEVGRLEDDYARVSLADGRASVIFDYYKTLQLLKRLNALEVTEEEYAAAKEQLKALDTAKIAQFIAEQSGKSIVLSRLWEKHIQSSIQFYETAHQRDSSIQPLLEEYFKRAGDEPAVLVYGGFHKESIKKILKENNISYKVVTPKIPSVSAKHQDYYKQIMRMGYDDIALPAALPRATRPPSVLFLSESGDLKSKARVDSLIDQVADIAVSRNSIPEMDLAWASRSETRVSIDDISESMMLYPKAYIHSKGLYGYLDKFDRQNYEFVEEKNKKGYWRSKHFPDLVLGSWEDIKPENEGEPAYHARMAQDIVIRYKYQGDQVKSFYYFDNHGKSVLYAMEAAARNEVPLKDNVQIFVDDHSDTGDASYIKPIPNNLNDLAAWQQLQKKYDMMANFNQVLAKIGFLKRHYWIIPDPGVRSPVTEDQESDLAINISLLNKLIPSSLTKESEYFLDPNRPIKETAFINIDTDTTGQITNTETDRGDYDTEPAYAPPLRPLDFKFFSDLLIRLRNDKMLPSTFHASTTKVNGSDWAPDAHTEFGHYKIVQFLARVAPAILLTQEGDLPEDKLRPMVDQAIAVFLGTGVKVGNPSEQGNNYGMRSEARQALQTGAVRDSLESRRSETRSVPNPQIAALLKTLLDDALNPELEKSDRIYSILRIGEISKEAVKIKELGAAFIRPDQDQALAFAALQAIWEIIIFSPGRESLVMGLDILASAFMNEQLAPAVQILAGRILLFYIRRPHSSDDKIFAAIEIANKINSDQKTPGAVISRIIERLNEIPGDVTTYADHVMGELDQTAADVSVHLQQSKSEDLRGIYGDRFEEMMTFEGMLKGALIDYFEDSGWKGNPYYLFDQTSFFLGALKKVDFDKYPVIVRDLYQMGKRVWISAKSWKNLKDSGASNAPRSETRQTLARIFGPGKIKNVFEFAAGDGAWLNKLSKLYAFPWLDPDPVLAGFELPEPVYYADYGYSSEAEMVAAFHEKWRKLSERGIQIYTKESEIPDTEFDLLHVAFQPHDPDDLVFSKLSRFEKRLRPGGWVVFANDEKIILRSEINRWLIEHGYPFNEIHVFSNSEIPKDYPFSTWGEIQSKHTRYLIVAQKPLSRSETRQSDDSEMKKFLINALRQEAEDWGVDPDGVMADYKFYAFPPFTVMVSYDAEKDVVGIAMGKKDSENPRAYLIERGGKHVQVTQLASRAGVEIKIFKEAGDLEPDDSFIVGHTEKGVYFFIVTVEGGQKVSDPEITLFDDWADSREAPRSEARAGKIPVKSEHLHEIVGLLNEARVVDKQELKTLKVRVKKEVNKIDPAKQSQLEAILWMSVTSANELADGEELDVHLMRGALERLNAQIAEGRIEYIPRQGTFTLVPASAPIEKKEEPSDEISLKEILPADFIRGSSFFKQGIIHKIYKNHQKVKHLHLSVSAERINDPGLAFKLQQRLNRAGDELVYLTLRVRFPEETRYISILDTGVNLNKYMLAEILEGKDNQGETLLNQFELLLSVSEYRDAFHLRLISVGNETESKKINGDYKNHAEILQGEGYGQEIFSEMARWLRFRAAEGEKKIEISTIDGSAGKWTAKRMREFFNAEQITRKSKRYGVVSKREEILPGNTNDVWAGWITPESSSRSEARFAVSTKQLASQNVVFVDGAAEYQNPRDVAEELAILASSNPKQKVIVYNMRSEMRSFQNLHTLSADLKSFDLSNVQFVDGSLVQAARPYQYRENLDLVYYGNDKGEAVKAIQEMGVFSKRVTYFVGKPGALGYGLKYLPAVKLSKRVENLILQNGYYVVSPQASEWMRAIQQAQFVTVFARSA